jgi:NADP-dependent 3-hydroxy acid dehydrogenase YdfG
LDQAIKEVTKAHERIDVLIHSAATFHLGPWNALTPERLDELYRVNFRAPVLLTRSLLPALKAAQGAIVFLNSSAALEGGTNCGAYAALKASLKVFADTLRQEVNADRIRVLSVFPGRTASPMQERIFAAEGRTYPAERLLQPEDIASQVLAILSLPSTAEVTDLSIRPFQPIG